VTYRSWSSNGNRKGLHLNDGNQLLYHELVQVESGDGVRLTGFVTVSVTVTAGYEPVST
jgi:hypothetical protein